jgi:glucose/arabinose dehydrogenase
MYTVSGAHYGSRFSWDKEDHLFYSIGERGVYANAQDLSNPLGKVHRVNDDGTIPKDNPFVNNPNAVPSIWTYGNRNPQGFSWDPVTGKLWESEHGPTAGDEINVLKPGHNYGWGVVTKGSQDGITKTSAPGMDDPIVYYIPTLAPSGMTFYTGDKYPAWKNNLFVGGLAGQQLRRLEVADETVKSQEVIFREYGRVRDVVQGPDGYLYLLIQNATSDTAGFGGGSAQTPGLVARLVPAQ